MDYITLLDFAIDLGYELAMSGAETFRVEETVSRVLSAYGVESDVFAIPNHLIVTIRTDDRTPITRMRRIGVHGNDLDAVEKLSGLSRACCNRVPDPKEAKKWLTFVKSQRVRYSTLVEYLGDFLGGSGFAMLFGGNLTDALFAGICGILVGFVNRLLERFHANPFFRTIATSFLMALVAYGFGALGLTPNVDSVIIGALMLLVPGLLFTNAMRDIIYGDINSGINRIVQVFLTAVAIALGTAVAWRIAGLFWGIPISAPPIQYSIGAHCVFALIGCIGFSILFNIHGPGGLLCALGGVLSWAVYLIAVKMGCSDIIAYFWSALFASTYSEIMARIRKYPAFSYLVVSLIPLIPGGSLYHTMRFGLNREWSNCFSRAFYTLKLSLGLALGIIAVLSVLGVYQVLSERSKCKNKQEV